MNPLHEKLVRIATVQGWSRETAESFALWAIRKYSDEKLNTYSLNQLFDKFMVDGSER